MSMRFKIIDFLLLLNGLWLASAWLIEIFYSNVIFAWFDLRIFTIFYLAFVIYVILKNNK